MIPEFPLYVFTLLAGLAAGVYVFAPFVKGEQEGKNMRIGLPATCLVLLAIGAVALLTHLGHPERALNAFSNPSAGITLEAYASVPFGLLVVANLVLALMKKGRNKALEIVTAVFGVILLVAMGYAYFNLVGVAAWASWLTFPMFIVASLAIGAHLVAALNPLAAKTRQFQMMCIVMDVLTAVVFAAELIPFSSLGMSIALFVVSIVAAVVAVVLGAMRMRAAKLPEWIDWATFVLMFVSVAIARYGFYAAYMI